MREEERVLAANRGFYAAFAGKDAAAMAALWAQRAPVACIHPGWQPLLGREEVLASWRAILSGPAAPAIRCGDAVAHVLGDSAYVICVELIAPTELIATNVFVREDDEWRLAHHHASSMVRTVVEPEEDDDAGGLLH